MESGERRDRLENGATSPHLHITGHYTEWRAFAVYTAMLDDKGVIATISTAWEQGVHNSSNPLLMGAVIGANYPEICERAGESLTEGVWDVKKGIQEVLDGSRPQFTCEYPCHSLSGVLWLLLHVTPLPDGQGALVSHIDVTQFRLAERHFLDQAAHIQEFIQKLQSEKARLEAVNAHLEAIAALDSLTSLKNHRAFHDRLKQEFDRARRYRLELSLVLLDVDYFKCYNDAFGHPAGDTALIQFAQLLNAMARETDFIARYGGEEFAMILPNTDYAGSCAMAQRFRAAVQASSWPKRVLTASFGIASLSSQTVSPAQLIAEADEAMYASKRAGRNCVHHYQDLTTHSDDPAKE